MTTGVPGVAFRKTFYHQPGAFEGAMFLNGEDGVIGAGRIEPTAVAKHGTYRPLVEANQKNHQWCTITYLCVFLLPVSPAL